MQMSSQKIFLFLSFLVTIFASIKTEQIGDKCIIKATNQPGECKLDCPSAIEQAKRGIDITHCGFHALTTPILCCEVDDFRQDSNIFAQSNENINVPDDVFSGGIVFPDNKPTILSNNNDDRRISEQKCEEYSKEVTNVVHVSQLILPPVSINVPVQKCDYNSVSLIVGGVAASPGEFPFMAAIGFDVDDNKWRCGGTLISDRFILTAAHCTYATDAGQPTVVRLGDLILTSDNDGSIYRDYAIDRNGIFNHPDYQYPLKYHDIALIKTQTRVEFTNFTRPACLFSKATINRKIALAAGYGKTDFASESSNKLMKVPLQIYNNHICEARYKNNSAIPRGITSTMLCAGDVKGGKDTCQGDSGGPLFITPEKNQCKFYIVGVTSFGKSCGQVNTPALYTKVSDYLDWIESIVWQ